MTGTLRPIRSALRSNLIRHLSPTVSSTHLVPTSRPYASHSSFSPPPPSPYEIFSESCKARQRVRALLRLKEQGHDPSLVDYVREEIAERLAERMEDLREKPGRVLEVGAHKGELSRVLWEVIGDDVGGEGGKASLREEVLQTGGQADIEGKGMIREGLKGGKREWIMLEGSEAVHADEFDFPIERIQHSPSQLLSHARIQQLEGNIDAVVSGSSLHWVGDIVGALTQIRHVLRPDGVFLGAVLGGDTLFELRTSLQLAEQERRGGLANRVSPMINPTDSSSLLQRAGFTLTTVDVEDLTIHYPSMWDLMSDLRDMGESNAIMGRKSGIGRDTLIAADAIYNELYGKEDGTIPATFQIIFLIGWKPGPTEPKPLERGSAQTSLKDIL